ncbi:hypothetical protein EAF04_005550 [Stromatinia cepivora]|nr:hypothetical protein EAF04_005550 [Stromatinia cepivora]
MYGARTSHRRFVPNPRYPRDTRIQPRKPKWHGKGYREYRISLYFQLHRSYINGRDFSTALLISCSLDSVATLKPARRKLCMNSSMALSLRILTSTRNVASECALPEELHFEFFVRRTRIEGEDALVGGVFDGGETVYAKVFDGEGIEYTGGGWLDSWQAKERRGRG